MIKENHFDRDICTIFNHSGTEKRPRALKDDFGWMYSLLLKTVESF
jgi:hypothetical protein